MQLLKEERARRVTGASAAFIRADEAATGVPTPAASSCAFLEDKIGCFFLLLPNFLCAS